MAEETYGDGSSDAPCGVTAPFSGSINSDIKVNINQADEAAKPVNSLLPAATDDQVLADALANYLYPAFNAGNASNNMNGVNAMDGKSPATNVSSDLSDVPPSPEEAVDFRTTPEMMVIDKSTPINGNKHHSDETSVSEGFSDHNVPRGDGVNGPSIPNKRKAVATTTRTQSAKKRAKKEDWSAEHVLQDQTSPLAYANLKSLFANPDAMNVLTEEERRKLVSMLPNQEHVITDENGQPSIDANFLKYDMDWSHGLSRVKEDIAEGRNDPEWLSQAIDAFEQRKAGAFDQFKEQEYEEFWGSKQKIPQTVLAGLSSGIKWGILFRDGIFRLGDIFSLTQQYKTLDHGVILLEKEVKVIGIPADSLDGPTVSFAPGQYKISNPDLRADIILRGVKGPEHLVKAICKEDGRLESIAHHEWKAISVFRNNQDLGTIWDIRQAYQFGLNEGDYRSILFPAPELSRRRRLPAIQQQFGYNWVNPMKILVKKIKLSDLHEQHENEVLPISYELAHGFRDIAQRGYTFVKCDPRILQIDGMPCPQSHLSDGDSLLRVLELGPNAFPTEFTRYVAGRYGPGWSHGHAHIGSIGLKFTFSSEWAIYSGKTKYIPGFLPRADSIPIRRDRKVVCDPSLILTNDEKSSLKKLLASNEAFLKQDPKHLMAHLNAYFSELAPMSKIAPPVPPMLTGPTHHPRRIRDHRSPRTIDSRTKRVFPRFIEDRRTDAGNFGSDEPKTNLQSNSFASFNERYGSPAPSTVPSAPFSVPSAPVITPPAPAANVDPPMDFFSIVSYYFNPAHINRSLPLRLENSDEEHTLCLCALRCGPTHPADEILQYRHCQHEHTQMPHNCKGESNNLPNEEPLREQNAHPRGSTKADRQYVNIQEVSRWISEQSDRHVEAPILKQAVSGEQTVIGNELIDPMLLSNGGDFQNTDYALRSVN